MILLCSLLAICCSASLWESNPYNSRFLRKNVVLLEIQTDLTNSNATNNTETIEDSNNSTYTPNNETNEGYTNSSYAPNNTSSSQANDTANTIDDSEVESNSTDTYYIPSEDTMPNCTDSEQGNGHNEACLCKKVEIALPIPMIPVPIIP